MGKVISFIVSILFYLIGTGGLFYLILWTGNLLPFHPFEQASAVDTTTAILKNIGLILLFGVPHTIMARPAFKKAWTKIIPPQLERSTYVMIAGLLCFLIAFQWAPIAGVVWSFAAGTIPYYILYGLYFFGVIFLLSSSFLINHFELFGLQQGYFHMTNRKAAEPNFVEYAYYKIVRHPIYLGFMLVLFGAPTMTYTHMALAVGMTLYIMVGYRYEEKDLANEFGDVYTDYQKRVPAVVPFTKF